MRNFLLLAGVTLAACSVNPLDPDDIGEASLIPGGNGGGGAGGSGSGSGNTCEDLCAHLVRCCGGGDQAQCVQTCANDPQITQQVIDAYVNASCDDVVAETGCR